MLAFLAPSSRLLPSCFLALPVLCRKVHLIVPFDAGHTPLSLVNSLLGNVCCRQRAFATEVPRFGQPSGNVIKAIPFLVDPSQADEAYKRYHSEQPFLAPPRIYQKSKQVFLPFWAMSGTVAVNAGTAQVGYSRTRRRMNPRTGTWETQTYVEWQTYFINRFWERRYTAEQIQMYAGSKYPSSDVDCLAPGAALIHALPMKPEMMDEVGEGAAGGRLRRVYPFTMTPDTAINRGLEWIREQEEAAVKVIVLQSHPGADQVSAIELNLTLRSDFSAHPIFVPAYVFTLVTPLLKLKMRTYVGAFPGAPVSGTRMFDGRKVGAVVAAIAPIALLALGVVMPWSRLFWLGAVLPGATAGFTAHYFADLRSWYQKNVLSKQQEWEVQDHRNWNAEWVREYSRLDDQRRQQEQQEQEQDEWQRQEWGRQGSGGAARESEAAGPPGDSKGYYSLLGVPPNASTSEIQAAFRAAAFKHHPDRYQAPSDKLKATAAFQRMSEAYNTLRDTNRRRQYDLT